MLLRAAADGYDAVFTVSFCVAVLGVARAAAVRPAPRHHCHGGHRAAGRRGRAGVRPTAVAEDTAESAPAGPRAPVRALLGRPEVRRLTGCAVLLGLTTVSDSFLYLILQRRLDLPGTWFPLLPLGTAAASCCWPCRWGRSPTGSAAGGCSWRGIWRCSRAYGLLLVALAGGAALVCAVLALHGSFYAATDGVLAAATADAVPEDVRGSGLAVVQTGQTAARFVCSLAFGAAWTAWGDRTAVLAAHRRPRPAPRPSAPACLRRAGTAHRPSPPPRSKHREPPPA